MQRKWITVHTLGFTFCLKICSVTLLALVSLCCPIFSYLEILFSIFKPSASVIIHFSFIITWFSLNQSIWLNSRVIISIQHHLSRSTPRRVHFLLHFISQVRRESIHHFYIHHINMIDNHVVNHECFPRCYWINVNTCRLHNNTLSLAKKV